MAVSGEHIGKIGKALPGPVPEHEDDFSNLVGRPDGPMKFIPEFGFEVKTFLDPRTDLYREKDPGKTSLMHHVPIPKRGYYQPRTCADYDPEEYDYIVNDDGYALCTAITKSGANCSKRAMNMSWLCPTHGGKLHPLDKVNHPDRDSMQVQGGGYQSHIDPELQSRMTRLQKLNQGLLDVSELDDEELARGQCRDSKGGFTGTPPRQVPHAVHQRMVNELFKRADEKLQHSLISVVETMIGVASGDAYEPADRIKAATWIFERVRGKTPEVIEHRQDKPWEMALGHITLTGGSRAESRAARGLDPETGEPINAPMLVPANETPEQKRQRLLAELKQLDSEAGVIDVEEELACEFCDRFDDEGHLDDCPKQLGKLRVPNQGEVGEPEAEWAASEKGFYQQNKAQWGEEDEGWSNKPGEAGAYSPGVATPEPETVDDEAPGTAEERRIQAKKELAERLKTGRRQRGFARSQGRESVTETPFQIVEKGKAPQPRYGEGYLVGFKKQSTPGKKRGNDDFRHRI